MTAAHHIHSQGAEVSQLCGFLRISGDPQQASHGFSPKSSVVSSIHTLPALFKHICHVGEGFPSFQFASGCTPTMPFLSLLLPCTTLADPQSCWGSTSQASHFSSRPPCGSIPRRQDRLEIAGKCPSPASPRSVCIGRNGRKSL